MYVIGGRDTNDQTINSFEKLSNITTLPSALSRWQLIQPNQSFKPRCDPVFCAWNEREMVVLGGKDDRQEIFYDGWVLDSRT